MSKYYNVCSVMGPAGKKKHTIRIGSAVALDSGVILCTVEAAPLNWDGSFRLYPVSEEQRYDDE